VAPDHIETPLAAARAAREYVLVTGFLWDAVLRGSITIDQVAARMRLDEHNVALWPTRTQDYLQARVWNSLRAPSRVQQTRLMRSPECVAPLACLLCSPPLLRCVLIELERPPLSVGPRQVE